MNLKFAILCKRCYTSIDVQENIGSKTTLQMQGGFFMERKFKIQMMSDGDIARWYATIKPIVKNGGKSTYLRELLESELKTTAYNWLNEPKDYGDIVDYTKLSVLADVKMLHSWSYYGIFKPSVSEVIRQIPKEYLEKVVAFEIINGAIGMDTIFKAELEEGFHVSIVRLYQAKDETNNEAQPIDTYPTSDCKIPIGMTEEEFQGVKKIL